MMQVVKYLLDAGYDADVLLEDSALGCQGPLHFAASNGDSKLIALLLECNANADLLDGFKGTPIHMAAREGKALAVKQLMDAKADPHAQDDQRSTALHYAAEQGHADCVAALLRQPTLHLDLQDTDGDTALHLAAHGVNVIRGRSHVSVVEQLVRRGASIFVERKNGRKAFELTKNKEIRQLLDPKVNTTATAAASTPARRTGETDLPESGQKKRLRNVPSPLYVPEDTRVGAVKQLKCKHRKLEILTHTQVDADFFGPPIEDIAMYRNATSNNLLSGRYLRMYLIQKGQKGDTLVQTQWTKTDLPLWEPNGTPARRLMPRTPSVR